MTLRIVMYDAYMRPDTVWRSEYTTVKVQTKEDHKTFYCSICINPYINHYLSFYYRYYFLCGGGGGGGKTEKKIHK